jgi:ferredoxin-NADP reductase
MVSIYIGGRRLDRLHARAGQYFRWRFLTSGCWWQAHPFSLSAAPNERWLRLTVKVVGDHTEKLPYLRAGTRVFAEGPSGVFTADRRIRPRALLIAGGSGIAPIRALLEDLPRGTVVIYRARSADELVFRQELNWLADVRQAQVWYVLGSREDPAPRQLFTPKGMRELVPDIRRRDVFLCGPAGLVDTSVATLRRLRVPRRQIHLDPFEF